VDGYLAQFDKGIDKKAIHLYDEKFLLSVRTSNSNNRCYVRARCSAEMKKSVVYTVDIVLDNNGMVHETQCECGVGMGPDCHCKHVCCLLYGLINFGSGKELMLRQTCTEKLQTFHHCKKFKGSPLKANDLKLRQHTSESTISTLAAFDPRPVEYRHINSYGTHFRNQCIGYSGLTGNPMPILQLYPPANMLAVSGDHQYCLRSDEELFLEKHNLYQITEPMQKSIEQATREQSASSEWHKVRAMRIGSSHFGDVCKASEKVDLVKLARRIVDGGRFHSASVDHGLKCESFAVTKFEEISNIKSHKCGTFVSLTHAFLCSSPDRVVDDKTVIEVKCPYTARDREITNVSVPYLKLIDDKLMLDNSHNYYYQIQGQLYCSGRQLCIFIVYTLLDLHFEYIKRDDVFIAAMLGKLQTFYDRYFYDMVMKKHRFNDYEDYHFDY
jgi:hypothetical protein